jgi:hypothetical protein
MFFTDMVITYIINFKAKAGDDRYEIWSNAVTGDEVYTVKF